MNENNGSVGLKEDLVELSLDIDALLTQITSNFIECAKKRSIDDNLAQLTGLFCNKVDTFQKMIREVNTNFAQEEKISKLQETLNDRNRVLTEKCEALSRGFEKISSAIFNGKKAYKAAQKLKEESMEPEQVIRYAHQISKNFSVAAPHFWQQGDPMRPFPTDMQFRFSTLATSLTLNGPSELRDDASSFDVEVIDGEESKTVFNRVVEIKDDEYINYSDASSSGSPQSDHEELESTIAANIGSSSGYNVGLMSSDEDSSDSNN